MTHQVAGLKPSPCLPDLRRTRPARPISEGTGRVCPPPGSVASHVTPPKAQQPYCNCCCAVARSCPTLWDPVDCSTPGSPVLHISQSFLKFIKNLSRWYYLTISSSATPFSLCLQSFPASASFPRRNCLSRAMTASLAHAQRPCRAAPLPRSGAPT